MSSDTPGTLPVPSGSPAIAVQLIVEQLRRAVPGGIGTYITGLIQGLGALDLRGDPQLSLYASALGGVDPLGFLRLPVELSRFPSAVMTRLWRVGYGRVGKTAAVVHALSLAQPPTSARLVVTVHDLAWRQVPESYSPRQRQWHEKALHHAARHARALVVPSAQIAADVLSAGLDISPERLTVIEHGSDHLPAADPRATAQLLAELEVEGEFLLSVGTLEPRKNLVRLFEAYRLARPLLAEPWPLVVLGPFGWGADLQAPEGVVFAGGVPRAVLVGLYERARLLAYVPLQEGYGLPVVEAMRAGAPVLSSAVPSARGATLLVEARDVDQIAAALVKLSADEELRAGLIRAGHEQTAALTWAVSAARHVELWRDLASRP